MAKILKICKNTVIVGMDDHTTIEVGKTDFAFGIVEMMFVDVYKHNDKYLFSLPARFQEPTMELEDEIPGKIYVKKRPYVLWYFFIGGFGVHEFYALNKKKACAWIILTIFIYFIEGLPRWEDMLSHSGLHYDHGYYHRIFYNVTFSAIGCIYFLLIRILALVSMCKQANENGRITVSKWGDSGGPPTT